MRNWRKGYELAKWNMATLRVLALAAARRRIGSVVLDGGKLLDWRISDKAADSVENAVSHLRMLIEEFKPDVVITEEVATARHKGKRTLAIIGAMGEAAEHYSLVATALPREHRFENKYAEAEALVERFPELSPWKPVRLHFYDNEPRNTVLFEALALADQIIAKDS